MEKKRHEKKLIVTPQIRQLYFDLKSAVKQPDEYGASVKLALFLGAGASSQSGIPVAAGMIQHFKSEIYKRFGKEFKTEKDGDEWLKSEPWYQPGESDYWQLFEKCYQTEGKRRSYIESIIERKQPSVGYIVLANLIKLGYLKTIITTNFDSLVSLACSNYTDIYPVVYSPGNFASEMQVSSERPRILKIHGDFLFSRLKNTTEDLQDTDANMERQVIRILEEYDGLIVLGYGGGDHSVMSLFEKIPEGKTIYWCGLSEDLLPARVRKFLADKKGIFVKIEGFDELMQIARILIELDNQTIIKTFQQREIEINKKLGEFEDVLLVDEESSNELKNKDTTGFSATPDKPREITELHFVGNQALNGGNYKLAEESFRKVIKLDSNDATAYYNLGNALRQHETHWKEAEAMYRQAIEIKPNHANAYYNLGLLLAKDKNRLAEAEAMYRQAIEIKPNYAGFYYNLACLRSISRREENKEEAFENLKKAVEMSSKYKSMAKTDADFDFIRDDARFGEIVGSDE